MLRIKVHIYLLFVPHQENFDHSDPMFLESAGLHMNYMRQHDMSTTYQYPLALQHPEYTHHQDIEMTPLLEESLAEH